jgi:hypothetical protein
MKAAEALQGKSRVFVGFNDFEADSGAEIEVQHL